MQQASAPPCRKQRNASSEGVADRALWLHHAYRSARAACSARTATSLLKPRRAPRLALAPAAAAVVSNKRRQRRGLRSAPAGARSGAALSPALSSCCGAGLLLAPSATAGPRVASASASDAAAMPAAHSSAMRRRRGRARRSKSRAGALCANYRAREGWAHFFSADGRKQKGPRPPSRGVAARAAQRRLVYSAGHRRVRALCSARRLPRAAAPLSVRGPALARRTAPALARRGVQRETSLAAEASQRSARTGSPPRAKLNDF